MKGPRGATPTSPRRHSSPSSKTGRWTRPERPPARHLRQRGLPTAAQQGPGSPWAREAARLPPQAAVMPETLRGGPALVAGTARVASLCGPTARSIVAPLASPERLARLVCHQAQRCRQRNQLPPATVGSMVPARPRSPASHLAGANLEPSRQEPRQARRRAGSAAPAPSPPPPPRHHLRPRCRGLHLRTRPRDRRPNIARCPDAPSSSTRPTPTAPPTAFRRP